MNSPAMLYSDPMEQDDVYADVAQTQEATQGSTQQASQQEPNSDGHLWGFLNPCRESIPRFDFWKMSPSYNVGRGSDNELILPSLKISNRHCIISWDGKENETSTVTVLDLSSNGTFINGQKIGRGKTAILRDGNEIGFGSWASHPGTEDFRYIFRFTAPGPPRAGLYKFYDIGHELGKGTFATVMHAVSRETGEWYAVKMIQRSRFKAKGPESQRMFLREISILEELDHPNICSLKETFQDDHAIHIVLEYVNGGDLLDHIIKNGGLAEDHARYLTVQLCEALAYIHSKGIAHRDLKPENVLLTKTEPPIIKVADFGLAKAVNSMTMFKTTCGTPSYLAPEVILREPSEGYDHLVDSWSVGVIVFSMLTNTSPFIEDESQEDMAARFRHRMVDWNTLQLNNPSPEGEDFVRRLLEDDPRRRMSLTAALEHPWLRDLAHQRRGTPQPPPADPSFASIAGQNGSMLSNGPGAESQLRIPAHADMSQGFQNININEAQRVPGAFPGSQQSQSQIGAGRAGQKPLNRRVDELNSIDPEGKMQSWELITPGDQAAADADADAEAHANAKKRKQFPTFEESDSSLTPVSESDDQDGGMAVQNPANARTNGAKKKSRSGDPRKAKGAKVSATSKRTTRAGAARDAAVNGDDDAEMEVEGTVQNTRTRRQPARNARGGA